MDDTYAAQTAMPDNIRDLYRQILSQGAIGESLTLDIAQGLFPDREPDIQPEIPREMDMDEPDIEEP
jgi:hypothetical protein